METPLVSPYEGVVRSVHVARGRPGRRRRGARGARGVATSACSTTPAAFLAEAGPLLLADEARHNLILGIAGTLRRARPLRREALLGRRRRRRRSGRRRAADAAVQPHPRTPRDDDALAALAAAIAEELPGVVGARPEVEGFARLWSERHGLEPRDVRGRASTRSSRCSPVRPRRAIAPARDPGRPGLLLDWMRRVRRGGARGRRPRPRRGRAASSTGSPRRRRLPALGGRRRAGLGRRLGRPDAERHPRRPRLHAARSCAAAATRPRSSPSSRSSCSTAGRRFCFLYTDLANPTSNAIYERIGYVSGVPSRRWCDLSHCSV